MLALDVAFDFACCSCGRNVGVTVKCEGADFSSGEEYPTKVRIPCPHCSENSVVYFTTRGTLLRVTPEPSRVEVPAPSCN